MKTFRNAFGVTLGVIVAIIGITPQFLKDVGTFMDGLYTYIPSWGWLIISALIFIVLWVWNKIEDSRESKKSTNTTNQQNILDSGTGLQNPTFTAPVTFIQSKEDKKKRKVLNKLDWHVKQVLNEVVLHKTYPDKEISAKKKINEFWDFYQDNPAEISLILHDLIKQFSLEARKMNERILVIHDNSTVRNREITSGVSFENLTPLFPIEGIENKLISLHDEIHKEIYKELRY